MTAREDEIRRLVAELDAQVAEVEASMAALKALLADGEIAEEQGPARPAGETARYRL